MLRTGLRTGDTTPADRAKMLRKPPHILLTTPESLYLLLTAPRSRAMLRTVQAVIVDELHALIGSKRGAHLMLSLARLDGLCGRRVQRIGLSATIRPLERAAQFLAHPAPCAVVGARPAQGGGHPGHLAPAGPAPCTGHGLDGPLPAHLRALPGRAHGAGLCGGAASRPSAWPTA